MMETVRPTLIDWDVIELSYRFEVIFLEIQSIFPCFVKSNPKWSSQGSYMFVFVFERMHDFYELISSHIHSFFHLTAMPRIFRIKKSFLTWQMKAFEDSM